MRLSLSLAPRYRIGHLLLRPWARRVVVEEEVLALGQRSRCDRRGDRGHAVPTDLVVVQGERAEVGQRRAIGERLEQRRDSGIADLVFVEPELRQLRQRGHANPGTVAGRRAAAGRALSAFERAGERRDARVVDQVAVEEEPLELGQRPRAQRRGERDDPRLADLVEGEVETRQAA